jgi:hypothetical protein
MSGWEGQSFFWMSKSISLIGVLQLSSSVMGSLCPAVSDIQSAYVSKNFDVHKMQGTYYELAYHDKTQPSLTCGCERSVKWFVDAENR